MKQQQFIAGKLLQQQKYSVNAPLDKYNAR